MDILTALSPKSNYSSAKLQMIIAAWVMSGLSRRKARTAPSDSDMSEDDYTKQSIYSLLYAIYRSVGEVLDGNGQPYEFTFNTWGYAWPEEWGQAVNAETDPQIFGRNAYSGLFHFSKVKEYIAKRDGKVRVVELGCGTGAGAHHLCSSLLPRCSYEAVDMQLAGIATCRRKFVPELNGRLKATHADATKLEIANATTDFVVVSETHVTEYPGVVSDEDRAFLGTAKRILKPGGYLLWGNAIPAITWQPCFDYLESIGMHVREVCDVTKESIVARERDLGRVEAYVSQVLDRFFAFRLPFVGPKRRLEAEAAIKNFYRHPGTKLYENLRDGTDAYRVVMVQKTA